MSKYKVTTVNIIKLFSIISEFKHLPATYNKLVNKLNISELNKMYKICFKKSRIYVGNQKYWTHYNELYELLITMNYIIWIRLYKEPPRIGVSIDCAFTLLNNC